MTVVSLNWFFKKVRLNEINFVYEVHISFLPLAELGIFYTNFMDLIQIVGMSLVTV